ncbi:MAG: hypothetical protein MUC80_00845 [Candidatus Thermoplasmatota archaeon]|jgi:hypothetical protein|nr:hypothetical protein [Candidatus Thermoplasmatota archaeon]
MNIVVIISIKIIIVIDTIKICGKNILTKQKIIVIKTKMLYAKNLSSATRKKSLATFNVGGLFLSLFLSLMIFKNSSFIP